MTLLRTLALMMIIGCLVALIGCGDDDVDLVTNNWEPAEFYFVLPDTIDAEWRGLYRVVVNHMTPEADTLENYVIWTIRNHFYRLRIDSANHTGDCFCVVSGLATYKTDRIFFAPRRTRPYAVGCDTCDPAPSLEGTFQKELHLDTLVLTQLDSTTYKELRLTRTDE
jgi:hypothetical protein